MATRHPHPKATQIFARSVHRELLRAGYDRADLARFVNDMMGLITEAAPNEEAPPSSRVLGAVDPETSLLSEIVVRDVLEFELRRVKEQSDSQLTVVLVTVESDDLESADAVAEVHQRLASVLHQRIRRGDTVGRLDARRYLLVLPKAKESVIPIILARTLQPLTARARGDDAGWRAPLDRISARWVSWKHEIDDVQSLLRACEAAPRFSLVDFADAPEKHELPPQPGAVVLALGGGAARAVAHIGVLRALRAAGVSIAGIAGTSAGALVGAMSLLGRSEDEISERFVRFPESPTYMQLRRAYAAYARDARRVRVRDEHLRRSRIAFLSTTRLAAASQELFENFVGYFIGEDREISALSAPFAASATDLVDGRPVTLSHGSLSNVLRATCALPGLFPPQHDHGRIFVDGAVLSEVPVAAAGQLGLAAPILGVHLTPANKRWARFDVSEHVLARASSLAHTELVREQLRRVPVLLTVPVEDIGWLDFRRAKEIVALGEAATEDAIRRILTELDAATNSSV